MNELIISPNDGKMSSLEIAQITDKRHSDVLEAIRNMEPAWEKIAQRKFPFGSYKDANNQEYPTFIMNRDGFTLLAMGFTGKSVIV